MMILKFSIANAPTKTILKNLRKYRKFWKIFHKIKMAAEIIQKNKQCDPALRVFERKLGWRFTARLRQVDSEFPAEICTFFPN